MKFQVKQAESSRTPGKVYDVYRFGNGEVKCVCKGFLRYHRCRHLNVFDNRQLELFQ